jgi:hypothetical protein
MDQYNTIQHRTLLFGRGKGSPRTVTPEEEEED